MLGLADLRPGDIMVANIGGVVPGVWPVAAGQLLFAPAEMRQTFEYWWHWRHIGVVVENSTRWPKLVQAMPSGAEEITMTPDEHWTRDHFYLRPAYPAQPSVPVGNLGWIAQGQAVANAARRYVGTPYSFVDYVAIAEHRLRGAKQRRESWISRYVASSKRMICSQLADQALTDANYHPFTDGRLPQDVMPAELTCQLLAMSGQHVRPGDESWTDNELWPECCPAPV